MRTMSRRGRVWIRQMTIGDSESRGLYLMQSGQTAATCCPPQGPREQLSLFHAMFFKGYSRLRSSARKQVFVFH